MTETRFINVSVRNDYVDNQQLERPHQFSNIFWLFKQTYNI